MEEIEKQILHFKGQFYKRPEHVTMPTVWKTFAGKTARPDGTYPKFRIQDVTDEWIYEIIECASNFAEDTMNAEALQKLGSEEYINIYKTLWKVMLMDKVALICFTDDEEAPRLAGFQINEVGTKLRTEEACPKNIGNELLSGLLFVLMTVRRDVDIFEKFGVDAYMDAWGLFVKAEFRNQGIGYHLQHAKIPLCKALGIKVIANGFGSDIASHAAAKAGFELYVKQPITEFNKDMTSEEFNKLPPTNRYHTFMGMKVV